MSIVPSPLRNPLPGLFAKAQPRSVPLAWRNLVANKQRLLRSAAVRQLGVEQLQLATSADTGADPARVVGYGAFVLAA